MIAIISKTTSDSDMPVTLDLIEAPIYSGERRISTSKTLNEDTSFSDMGFTNKDRRFNLKFLVSESTGESLQTLLENNSELTLALWQGLYKVAPLRLRISGNGVAVFQFAIKSKLSA